MIINPQTRVFKSHYFIKMCDTNIGGLQLNLVNLPRLQSDHNHDTPRGIPRLSNI